MKFEIVACIFVVLVSFTTDGSCIRIDATKLATELKNLMTRSLGVHYIQNVYNNQSYDEIELKGEVLLNSLTTALSSKIGVVRDQLLLWKKAIEEDYRTTTSPLGEKRNFVSCCTYSGKTTFDYRYDRKVDLEGVCELTHLNREPSSDKFRRLNLKTTKAFTNKAHKDLENKGLYIYYGQEDGYYLQYPGMKYDSGEDCYAFDPRTRPWYISAATQKSKDVVFLVDVSKNINKKLTKELVETFLKTLDPRDKISVIPFAKDLFLHPEHCFNSQLVHASPGNLLALKNHVLSLIEKSDSNLVSHSIASYKKAFEKAFKEFRTTNGNPEKLVFLATAGIYSDDKSDVMQTIFDGNKRFSFEIAVSAFAITTSGMNSGQRTFHENMVNQKCILYQVSGCSSNASPKKGRFIHVTTESDMRNKFGSFYTFLDSTNSDVSVRYSFPYVDFFGTGILISVSIPTFENSKLKGVVGIDLAVSELLSDVTYFKEGHNAYRFLIGKSGLVYQHPLLPKPVLAFEPTVPVDISLFENGTGFDSIKLSMLSGGSDVKAIVTERSISRGDSSLEGAVGVTNNYTYYWKLVPYANFSLAVVIETSNANQYQLKGGIQSQNSMIYHRLDRIGRGPQYPLCRSTQYLMLRGNSTTKLPADAFGSPSNYYAEETENVVRQIMEYFSTNKNTFPTLLESQTVANRLRTSISLTSGLDDVWRGVYADYIAFRYIATEDGVFRIFPGIEVHPLYDPRTRAWYQRSLLYPDTTVISTPYFQNSTATMIITLSYLIQKTINNTKTNVAVMGLDMSMYYVKKLLLDNIDGCRDSQQSHSCIVVDNSGLVIFHPDFTKAEANQTLQGQHITKLVPGVAKDLINSQHLVRKSCIGIYNTNKSSTTPRSHLQYFYVLSAKTTISKAPTSTRNCPEYSLVPLKNTNTFVLIVRNRCLKQENCHCPADGTCTTPIENYPCHCPCKHFLVCDEHLNTLPTTLMCPPPPTNLLLPVKTEQERVAMKKEALSLQRCQDPKCGKKTTWDSCIAVGCQWCFLNSEGKLLSASDQYCGYSEVCPRGKLLPVVRPKDPSKDTNIVAIVVPIVVIIVVIGVIVSAWWFFRLRKRGGERESVEMGKAVAVAVAVPKPRSNEVAI